MAAFSGKNALITVGSSPTGNPATVLLGTKWSITFKTDELDITTFETLGFGDWTNGLIDADISFDAFWDSANDPHASPPGLMPGRFQYIRINVDVAQGGLGSYVFTRALVCTVNVDAEVRGLVKFSVTAKNAAGITGATPPTYA